MSGTEVGVRESNVFEEDDPNTGISARTLTRHKSSQLSGDLGPKMRGSLLDQELLMSESCNPDLRIPK